MYYNINMNETELLIKFNKKKEEINTNRKKEEELKSLSKTVSEKSVLNRLDKIEKELSHREMLDAEFREAMAEARERRYEAKYRDLIDAADKMKKHLNILDGLNNTNTTNIMIVQPTLLKRYAPHLVEETTRQDAVQIEESNEGVLCSERSTLELREVGKGNKEHQIFADEKKEEVKRSPGRPRKDKEERKTIITSKQ